MKFAFPQSIKRPSQPKVDQLAPYHCFINPSFKLHVKEAVKSLNLTECTETDQKAEGHQTMKLLLGEQIVLHYWQLLCR